MPVDPVYEGPRWYRERIRRYGPLLALVVPAVLGAVGRVRARPVRRPGERVDRADPRRLRGARPAVVGVPFASSDTWYPIGIALSVPLWLVVGYLAARTATRNPVATWRDFWRAYRWLAVGVWVGVARRPDRCQPRCSGRQLL